MKLIGLGAGNSEFEIDFFRKNMQLNFHYFLIQNCLSMKK